MEAKLLKLSKPSSSECIYPPSQSSLQRKFNVSLNLCSVKAIPLLTIVSTKGDKVGTTVHNILSTVQYNNAQGK